MTLEDFDAFLSGNPDLKFQAGRMIEGQFQATAPEQGQGIAFNWPGKGMPFYDNGGMLFVESARLNAMDSTSLAAELVRGNKVEGITRITGYFTKLSSWNKGKKGELKDRNKNEGSF